MRAAFLVIVVLASASSRADDGDALHWSGFALLRAGNAAAAPLEDDAIGAQAHLSLDWRPSMSFGAHLHLLGRSDDDDSRRGHAGVVEAWLDQNLVRGDHRLRLMEGAFFLPTSRENVDALWETPYTITPSALNSWLGEELRPIGVDAAYTYRRRWTGGATLFRGNDTLGALPAVRGWVLRDRWALLGEHLPVDAEYFASVSAETDGRLGWSARGRWNNDHASAQLTWIDNRSDAIEHGELLNWATRFAIAGGDWTLGEWTLAAESGWGETDVIAGGTTFTTGLGASYVLVSRRLSIGRVSLRADQFRVDSSRQHAVTGAFFFSPQGPWRAGIEAVLTSGERRVAIELRGYF